GSSPGGPHPPRRHDQPESQTFGHPLLTRVDTSCYLRLTRSPNGPSSVRTLKRKASLTMNRRPAASIPFAAAATAALIASIACSPPKLTVPGAQLSGTVTIASTLKPLLPPPAGAQGT